MFSFDFPLQLQQLLNQHWLAIHFGLIFCLLFLIYLTYKKPVLAAGIIIILLPTYLFRTKIFGLPTTYLEMCLWAFFVTWFVQIKLPRAQKLADSSLEAERYAEKDNLAGRAGMVSDPAAAGEDERGRELGRPPRWRRPTRVFEAYPRPNLPHLPLILLLLAATLSIFISPNPTAALGLWKAYFLEPILFFLILLKIIKAPKDKEIIFWSLGISTLSISLYAIFQKFTGFGIAEPHWLPAATRRVTAFFTSPNAVGLYLGPIFVLYLTSLLSHLKKNHLNYRSHPRAEPSVLSATPSQSLFTVYCLHIALLLPTLLAIIFTKSQGTWLGVLAGLIFFIFFYKASVPSAGGAIRIIRHLAIILIILMFIAVLTLPPLRQTILPILTFSDVAGQNRLALWQGSWRFLTASPKNFIFGAGLFGFPEIHEQFRNPLKTEPLIYPHNIFLNFWLDTGLLGLIAITWIVVLFFKTVLQNRQSADINYGLRVTGYGLPVLAALITLLVHGLVDVPYFKNDLAILFWVIVSLSLTMKQSNNRAIKQ